MLDDADIERTYSPNTAILRANVVSIVEKMLGLPVELGTDFCKSHLKANPSCNNCISFHECSLVMTILNWLAQNMSHYTKDKLQSYLKGLMDGYVLSVTGIPETLPEE